MIPPLYARIIRTFMFTCGMYDASGEFAIKVGIPAKSGVSGPALDIKGNSVAGVAVAAGAVLAGGLGYPINLYGSPCVEPDRRVALGVPLFLLPPCR